MYWEQVFNVSAYVSEQAVRTTLVSGKVRVGDRLTGKGEVILPGQQAEWKDGAFKTKRSTRLFIPHGSTGSSISRSHVGGDHGATGTLV